MMPLIAAAGALLAVAGILLDPQLVPRWFSAVGWGGAAFWAVATWYVEREQRPPTRRHGDSPRDPHRW